MTHTWLALAIGNSRLHWARFVNKTLQETWHTPHQSTYAAIQEPGNKSLLDEPIMIASVVPEQSQHWTSYPNAQFLSLKDIPLQGMYATLGVDRALAAWGAIQTVGSPVLVIDAGTALTFTGINPDRTLIGGAILPGLRLQVEALGLKTAALPLISLHSEKTTSLPPRWARQTEAAIASGILYTVQAGVQSFIEDWQQQFPESAVVITGGDGDRLLHLLTQQQPTIAQFTSLAPHLIFHGMASLRSN